MDRHARQTRPLAQPSTSPSARIPAGATSIPDRWPPSAVGTPMIAMGESMARMVPHHRAMRIADFALERYFARVGVRLRPPAVRVGRRGLHDVQAADPRRQGHTRALEGPQARLHRIGGPPTAAPEIAATYETIEPDEVLTFAGAEEAIFCLMNVLVGPGDHIIATWPGYQSLYEVARATGAEITLHGLHELDGWAVDIERLRSEVRPTTRVIVVNTPHNPTGMMLDRTTYDGLLEIAEEGGIRLFMDEVYRGLEFDETDRLAAGADALPTGISLGVMSKAYALAGLRIGWIATHDRDLLARLAAFKDYTTICSSGPSEILAIIALRARDRVLERSRGDHRREPRARRRVLRGLSRPLHLDPPERRVGRVPAADRAGRVDRRLGGRPGQGRGRPAGAGLDLRLCRNHFRLGFGRTDLPKALAKLEAFAAKTLR